MTDYRDATKETSLTQEQRTRLEQAVAQARRQHETASTSKPAPRIVSRRTFTIGAAAAFVGLAGFGAINVIGGIPNNPVPNAFDLKAYALDDPARPSGYTEVLTKTCSHATSAGTSAHGKTRMATLSKARSATRSGSTLNASAKTWRRIPTTSKTTRRISVLREKKVPSLRNFSQRIFLFEKIRMLRFIRRNEKEPAEAWTRKRPCPLIVLALPMNEEFQAAYESACLADQQNTMTTEAGDAFDRLIELNAAQRISACLLKVTATYEDGASEAKKYMISPVENLEELYLAFQEKRSERLLKEWKGEPQTDGHPEEPELYTITQVA